MTGGQITVHYAAAQPPIDAVMRWQVGIKGALGQVHKQRVITNAHRVKHPESHDLHNKCSRFHFSLFQRFTVFGENLPNQINAI
jgi:hypothetical protein